MTLSLAPQVVYSCRPLLCFCVPLVAAVSVEWLGFEMRGVIAECRPNISTRIITQLVGAVTALAKSDSRRSRDGYATCAYPRWDPTVGLYLCTWDPAWRPAPFLLRVGDRVAWNVLGRWRQRRRQDDSEQHRCGTARSTDASGH